MYNELNRDIWIHVCWRYSGYSRSQQKLKFNVNILKEDLKNVYEDEHI